MSRTRKFCAYHNYFLRPTALAFGFIAFIIVSFQSPSTCDQPLFLVAGFVSTHQRYHPDSEK
jgi:hypothetical protein